MSDAKKVCLVEGCGKPVEGKGLCNSHRIQWNRYHRFSRRPPAGSVHLSVTFRPEEWMAIQVHAVARGLSEVEIVRHAALGLPLPDVGAFLASNLR